MKELIWEESKITVKGEYQTLYGIYVIRENKNIIRIGESASGFKRIKGGFSQPFDLNRKGKNIKNYYAYHWREYYNRLEIDYFDLKNQDFEKNDYRRSLEAELTFQVRLNIKKWPEAMTEVHFSEKYRTEKLIIENCKNILKMYGMKFKSRI